MRENKLVLVAVGATLIMACNGEPNFLDPGPGDLANERTQAEMHFLRQSDEMLPVVSFDGDGSAPQAGGLETYSDSFWAIKGKETSLEIEYANGEDFLDFEVGKESLWRRPDGSEIEWGDSILITVTVDSVLLLVELQPSGLMFNPYRPAELEISYAAADPDFNGDGVVDWKDAEIERNRLAMWMQQEETDPWHVQRSEQDIEDRTFTGWLLHFSNYAVSW
ncbi:MAG: hypothetical protein OEY63_01380 [Gemmatimonadota bacterium]|nr:hypothetical protein [Gemmatimonadota bacterium]MDH5804218.1 hypothetical protein [Gemmatimonadota bacterium]